MATVTKDFRVKSGLVVEGTTGTINGSNILTEASTSFLENYVKDAAGGLLANATLTNIQVSYDENTNGLSITAENGVADSTTDQLTEGSTRLYFTVDRAQDAAAELLTSGSHNGIEFSYDDVAGTITATVTGASVPTFSTGIVFEGGAPDNFETTLAVTEPTQDNTITLKDASGTVAFESDITDAIDAAGTRDNTANTLVKRDGFGNAAIGQLDAESKLTAPDYRIGNAGQLHDNDGDLQLIAYDNNTLQLNADMDVNITSGTSISLNASGTIDLSVPVGYAAYVNQDEIVTVSDSQTLTNKTIDSQNNTITVTSSNVSDFSSAAVTANEGYWDTSGAATTAEQNAKSYADGLASNYDAAGSASNVQTNLDNHILDTSAHGVTGDVVGTTDTQSLSNKIFMGQTNFQSAGGAGGTNNHIDVDSQTGKMTVTSGYALDVTASNDVTITSNSGDVVLNPDGGAYVGSVSAGNEIATNAYVDNAVSGLAWKEAVHLLYDVAIPVLSGSGASQLIIDGHDPLGDADSGYRVLITQSSDAGIYVFNSTSGNWTLTRAEDADAFGELVGAAVFVMEGTTYGSTSWVQSNHYLTNFTGQTWTQFSGQGSVTAGTGISVNGLQVSIDRTTVDAWYDAAGAAGDAEAAANDYTDGEITTALSTAQGYATTAEQNAIAYADGLTTEDIAEDSSALYFTDARAVSALEAVVPNFTEVDINSVAKQIAATSSVSTAGQAVGYAFAKADYRSAEFLVKVAYGTHTEVSKVILTLDTTDNIAITEYAVVGTNGSASTISAGISGSDVQLLVTTAHNSSTVTVSGTLLV